MGEKAVDTARVEEQLRKLLEKKRGRLDDMRFDPSKNVDFDAELARIGREVEEDDKQDPN